MRDSGQRKLTYSSQNHCTSTGGEQQDFGVFPPESNHNMTEKVVDRSIDEWSATFLHLTGNYIKFPIRLKVLCVDIICVYGLSFFGRTFKLIFISRKNRIQHDTNNSCQSKAGQSDGCTTDMEGQAI